MQDIRKYIGFCKKKLKIDNTKLSVKSPSHLAEI